MGMWACSARVLRCGPVQCLQQVVGTPGPDLLASTARFHAFIRAQRDAAETLQSEQVTPRQLWFCRWSEAFMMHKLIAAVCRLADI